MEKRIIIGSDHAGFERKEDVKKHLIDMGFEVIDVSEPQYNPDDDYPQYAAEVARRVSRKEFERGITLCGSGIGASIAANRFRGIRAALCTTPDMARMSRCHNNCNVLVLGERLISKELALQIVDIWLATSFEGGRHARRVDQLDAL